MSEEFHEPKPIHRPDAVSGLAFLMLFVGLAAIYRAASTVGDYVSDPECYGDNQLRLLIGVALPFGLIVPAWGLLRGQSWARLFYFFLGIPGAVAGMVVTFVPSPSRIVQSLVVFFLLGLSIIVLRTKSVNRFFDPEEGARPKRAKKKKRAPAVPEEPVEPSSRRRRHERFEY